MKKNIDALYIPRELEAVQLKLRQIVDDYLTAVGPEVDLANAIIVRLHKAGYKIVKL